VRAQERTVPNVTNPNLLAVNRPLSSALSEGSTNVNSSISVDPATTRLVEDDGKEVYYPEGLETKPFEEKEVYPLDGKEVCPPDGKEVYLSPQKELEASKGGPEAATERKKVLGLYRRTFWIIVGILLFIVIGLAAGLGAGLGTKHKS
jgi:hypothetical protein